MNAVEDGPHILAQSAVRLGRAAAPKSSNSPVSANLGSFRSHRSNPLSRFLLVLSTYALPSFTLTHSLSLSSSFISAVIGPLPDSSLWHNITQNSLFKYSFCKKSFHPSHRPNSDNRLLPLSPSIAPCFASPLDCLATHQKDAIYQPHSCQHGSLLLRYCRNVRPTWVKFDSKDTKESEWCSRF